MANKALLLGINNYRNVNSLRGCVNDVENMRELLTEIYEFNPSNVKILLNEKVIKKDVKSQMTWLFRDAKPGDNLVFHFSGHGSQIADVDGDEDDGADELICLYDMDFDDPESYFRDDELREWTNKLPAGVQLTIVLDNCNSGSGTRMLMAPIKGKTGKRVPMMVDPTTTARRALTGSTQARGLQAADAVVSATDPASDDLVRVRYVEPPQEIKEAIEKRRRRATRGLVVVDMNHNLLAGCRDDQTSADATIDQSPNGAFTYYLCKTIRESGPNLKHKELIDLVAQALSDGNFSQIPQLEGRGDATPLFGNARGLPRDQFAAVDASLKRDNAPDTPASGDVSDIKDLIPLIALLAPEAQVEAVRLFGSQPTLHRRQTQRSAGQRFLIYVHGICKHDAGYSNGWWDALHPFTNAFGGGVLGDKRREVLWSDLVNQRALEVKANRTVDQRAALELTEQDRLKEEISEALRDRADRQIIDAIPESAPDAAPRALTDTRALSIPGLNCLDDFTVYMVNNSVRAQVISRFISVVGPLLESGAELDIVSHSWGTVVAYEGLRELADRGATNGSVRNFFTVGAALSIGPVKMSLRTANKDGRRPAMVQRWINLNARGDIVGGPLQGRPYAVDHDFPTLNPFNCTKVLGFVSPACAHSSYFVSGNNSVNRDIFAAFITQR